jgi:hypothetical protein
MAWKRAGIFAVLGIVLTCRQVHAAEPDTDPAPWNFTPTAKPSCKAPFTLPMFGDQFQFGFNFGGGQFQGGGNFQQGGGNFQQQGGGNFQQQGGGNFQGGGGFQQGGQGGGNFQQGGGNFQGGGGFQQGGGGFQQGGGGFQGGFQGGAPIAVARGSFKIAENASPRPQDRVFASYNYYNNVIDVLDVHRETIGFEKTFLDGNASVEMRLPFIQNRAPGGQTESEIADLSVIFKYAFINTPDTVLSAGLAVTAPTGPIPTVLIFRNTDIERVHPWLLQPFVGYYKEVNDFYLHGFTSVMVPTDSHDGTLLFNDLGVGYWLYRGGAGLVTGIAPTFEAHVTTPLSNRGIIGFADSVDLTAGAYFLLGDRLCLGAAVGAPVTGPRLFDFEALFNLNWRF